LGHRANETLFKELADDDGRSTDDRDQLIQKRSRLDRRHEKQAWAASAATVQIRNRADSCNAGALATAAMEPPSVSFVPREAASTFRVVADETRLFCRARG